MGKYKIQDYSITEAMQDVKKGEFIIPNFQRDFVWKADKIVDLFKSIKNNYPIGVLTTSSAVNSTFVTGKNEIIEAARDRDDRINWIVVDGQQRMTSITIVYYAFLLKQKINSFTLDTREFLKKCFEDVLFYEKNFFTKKDLKEKFLEMGWEKNYINQKLKEFRISNQEINAEVQQNVGNYVVQILRLDGWEDEEVIDIFTAMNKGAKPLTHVDLMNGSMYNVGDSFDLLSEIKNINSTFKNIGEIKPEFMVQLMKTFFDIQYSQNGDVDYRKQELLRWSLDKRDVSLFIKILPDFKKTLIDTLSILDTKFDFYSLESMPKNVYLISALSVVTKCDSSRKKQSKEIWKQVISFITKRLINGDYASSPGAKALEDINKFILPLIDGVVNFEHSRKELISMDMWTELLSEVRKLSYSNKESALFKLATSILKSKHPKMLFDRGYVPVKPTEVTKLDTDLHHFIPKKSAFVSTWSISDDLINSIGNIVLITADENRNEIRNKNLSKYIKESRDVHKDDMNEVLDSHLIDFNELEKILNISDKDSSVVVNNKVKDFFLERTDLIASLIFKEFIEIKNS